MASLNDVNTRVGNLENNCIKTDSSAQLESLELYFSTPFIDFHYNNSPIDYTSRIIEHSAGALLCEGTFAASQIFNAVWNDYAEFYERGEYTEPGDIIGLNPNSDKEEYIKATNPSMCVGVHSDEYGHLIGGEQAPEGKDFVEYNMDKFIPVGLVGRVKTKIVGPISIGDKIVLSDIPGVGRKFIKGIDDSENIIGMAVENKTDESISRIRAHLRMGGGWGTNPQFYWI